MDKEAFNKLKKEIDEDSSLSSMLKEYFKSHDDDCKDFDGISIDNDYKSMICAYEEECKSVNVKGSVCPICGNNSVIVEAIQSRSTDEAQTIVERCIKCNYKRNI